MKGTNQLRDAPQRTIGIAYQIKPFYLFIFWNATRVHSKNAQPEYLQTLQNYIHEKENICPCSPCK